MKKLILSALIIGITSTVVFSPVVSHASESNISTMVATNQTAGYSFVSIDPTQSISDTWKTPLKQVDNTIYQTSIVGKSYTGEEEGFSTVLIKNTKTNSYSEYKLQTNTPYNQDTPLKVACGTQDTLFIIVGSAYGTLSYGGSLYSLNVKTGETKLVASPTPLEQIVDAKINGSKLNLTIYLFDDNYMNYTSYNKLINY